MKERHRKYNTTDAADSYEGVPVRRGGVDDSAMVLVSEPEVHSGILLCVSSLCALLRSIDGLLENEI